MKIYTSQTEAVKFTPTKAESVQGFLAHVWVPDGTIIRQTDLRGGKVRGRVDQDIEIVNADKGKFRRM